MKMSRYRWSVLLGSAVLLAGCSPDAKAPAEAPSDAAAVAAPDSKVSAAIGPWGFDIAGMNTAVKPGEDFFEYANGRWLTSNEIPADLTSWNSFSKLTLAAEDQIHAIVDGLPADAPAGSNEQKVRDFYRAYLDEEGIERAGMAPAKAGLEAIEAAKTHADIAALMGRQELLLPTPLALFIAADDKNPNRYIVTVTQAGIGLPDRDYYLGKDEALRKIRTEYQAHIGRIFGLLGVKDADTRAKTVFELETRMARQHWPIEKRRERELTYNLKSREDLEKLAPQYPWQPLLSASELDGQKEFVVAELGAIQALAKDFVAVPVAAWRDYLTYYYVLGHASILPKAFDEERFAFFGRTLNGQPQQRERWKRAVQTLDRALGEVVGQIYVQRHFPAESKAQVLALVENLRAAYAKRIEQLPWMSPETKKVAQEKLATFKPKIGYPDKWRDYSGLEIRAGDAFGNLTRASMFQWQFEVSRLAKPTDRDEWLLTPQTINAYYNPTYNEIVFPAAILQPPFFDPKADPAVNYGGIGGVIGHEMGHGFDDQGAKSDAQGVLRTWWQPQDETAFKKLVDALVEQYNGYEALPGLKLNGRLTAGENIGDLGGLTVAYEAYQMSLKGQPAPELDGFSGDQRFFLSWAQVWRSLQREPALRNQVLSNPHSPSLFRVQGVVRNMDQWYSAFNVTEQDKLFLPAAQRVRIW